MREVAVIGVGMTKFGELWDMSLRDLFVEAALGAMKGAGTDSIDSIYVGNMSGGQFVGQEHLGPLMADHLGLGGVPATRVESACASGGMALRSAYLEVASGMSDLVLASGVEKMNDGADVTGVLATASDQEEEVYYGVTFPGLYAMIARAHMEKYGTTEEDMSWVSVKAHRNGAKNPHAQFRRVMSLEDVLTSSVVAEPLRLLHCSPVTDGGAAMVLCPLDRAHEFTDKPVKILASGAATSSLTLADRADPADLDVVELSGNRAYEMAGVTAEDIDVAEVHDCFAIAEICCYEALGFVEKGFGKDAAREGITDLGGKIPVNVSGGLKSKGHPVGATGIAQAVTIIEQLRGEGGEVQVEGAKIGLAQNMGGSGASSVVHIFQGV
ncbi:MAG: thiolase domain-containing protein [Gemmatimonadetes bacterium]|nr:thiolase domain-containing protein [Gemmatimonadota bacterium]